MNDRFLIAPLKSGLINNLPAWQTPEDSFYQLENAYVFRGRVLKRIGSQLMGSGSSSSQTAPLLSRLRIMIGTTDINGDLSGTVPGDIFEIGQQFSIGDEIFTVNITGVNMLMLDNTGLATTKTYDTTTGDYVFVGAAADTDVYFYPSLPVMGICNYQIGSVNKQPTFAFDTEFAYQFVTTAWTRLGTAVWQGSNLNYFWTCNWQSDPSTTLLFVSNFNVANPNGASLTTDDPMWYWNGATSTWYPLTGAAIFAFAPNGMARITSPYVFSALIIVAFKNMLLLLNVIENDNANGNGLPGPGTTNTWYPNRCRFSFVGSPLAANAWYNSQQSDNAGNNYGGGGFLDAPTKEAIVSAEFIKDRLIVYFERSTYEIVYTGGVPPLQWQKINTELGAISTHSVIPFDKAVLGIGDTGVHACSGSNVERIDEKIPDKIFDISQKNNGAQRVAGIRDFFNELAYWAYTSGDINTKNTNRFTNKILVYNYQNATWAIWDDSFTSFGYFYQQSDVTWNTIYQTWEEYSLAWNEGIQYQQSRRVLAGNQQGYVVIINRDMDVNAQAYTITDATIAGSIVTLTIIDHTFAAANYIYVLDLNGITGFSVGIYQVASLVDANTITLIIMGLGGVYVGGGTCFRVSQIDILSKQWNPYIKQERSFYLAYIDFCVEKTSSGQITVDYYSSASNYSNLEGAADTGALLGTSILETSPYALVPFEQVQDLLWHRVYFQADGQFIQIRLYLSPDQITNSSIALDNFTLEGLILSTTPTSYTMSF